MNDTPETEYADVASWELSDNLWAQIEPLLPQVKWEKKASNYLSLLYFACAIICWRKCEVYGQSH